MNRLIASLSLLILGLISTAQGMLVPPTADRSFPAAVSASPDSYALIIDADFSAEKNICRNNPIDNVDPLGLTAWEWMITGEWNPSEAMLQGAYAGLHQANVVSQIAAGAVHAVSDVGGHLVDIGRGAIYAAGVTEQTPEQFAQGSWGALAKKQATQMAQGTYGAKELGKDVLQTELAINPVTGAGLAGYTLGTGIYEGNAVTVGEGAAQFAMLAAPYKGVEIKGGPFALNNAEAVADKGPVGRWFMKGAENDATYMSLSPEAQTMYNLGQKTWSPWFWRAKNLGRFTTDKTGRDLVAGVIKRGRWVERNVSTPVRVIRMPWDLVTGLPTTLSTGPTPDIRQAVLPFLE